MKKFFSESRIVRSLKFIINHTGLDKFFLRFVVVVAIVFGFYNPTRYSYANWVLPGGSETLKIWVGQNLWEIFFGILFLSAAMYLLRTTHKALGPTGTTLLVAAFAAVVALFAWNVDVHWTGGLLIALAQVGVSVVFTIGLLSANLNRRISGQITTVVAGPVQTDSTDSHHHG